jgi:tellurite resistance protein TerC
MVVPLMLMATPGGLQAGVGPWLLFCLFVVAMLLLDLFVFHRQSHVIALREAALWCVFWVALAMGVALVMYFWRGSSAALLFLTGYVVELSLSVDNLFVFLLLFTYFAVPAKYQHRVLFWGIVGAVLMRVLFIVLGVALINRLHWVLFIFGAFLVFTGIRMVGKSDEEVHPERNPVLKLARRFLPVSTEYRGGAFFFRDSARRLLVATPLFIVLLVVETTDVVFAVDSVPAVIGVIRDPVTGYADPFLAFTSNICAVLGLRAMYFALAGLMRRFRFLNYGLAAILSFVGVKMLMEAAGFYHLLPFRLGPLEIPKVHITTPLSLAIVGALLALSLAASLLLPVRTPREDDRRQE